MTMITNVITRKQSRKCGIRLQGFLGESFMGDCIFCDIVTGEEPASIVYEDDLVIAIMDIGPVNPGHLMVIPKKHVPYMADIDEDAGAHLFRVTMRIAQAVRSSGVRCEGINLFLADGEAAFQEVFHLHMHIIPRFRGDKFKISADWAARPPREELDEIAARIRRAHDMLYINPER